MTKEHIDRFERMHRPGGLIEPLTAEEAEEDYRHMVELQEQLLEYAYTHENYSVFMNKCYEYLVSWYWVKRQEKLVMSIEEYKEVNQQKKEIFVMIERHVMSCIVDKLEPSEARVIQIARNAYSSHKWPF